MMPMDPSAGQPPQATDALLEYLLDAVLVVDEQGTIIYANRAALALFEKPADALLQQPFGFPVLPYEMQEIDVLKAGQLLTVQMLAAPIRWGTRNASLLSLRDITAQKKLLEELEKKNDENAQYASLASHDLKEPVRKILVYSDLLLQHNNRPAADQQKIEKIRSSAQKMSRLISGIAELSRVAYVEHAFEPVDLNAVVAEVRDDLELLLREKKGTLDAGHLPVIAAIPGKMYQLFLNLVSNSLKYARKDVPPQIRIHCKPVSGGRVQVVLQDNGIGFDSAAGAQLFEPFRRLHKREYEGIGIGLSLCKRIVEIHHGEIRAEGVEGAGATFLITLPVEQDDADVAPRGAGTS